MRSTNLLKNILRWLWTSLLVMIVSCVRKSILVSLSFEQILEGLLLYAGYLLFIIPAGILLLKSRLFDDESKTALLLLCFTYFFFEYLTIFTTWEQLAKRPVLLYFYNAQHMAFILTAALCGIGLILCLGKMNQKKQNRKLLLFTTLVLSVVPLIDLLQTPNYKFNSDLFNVQQSNKAVDQASIPKRIFWIILDGHPSSLVLDEVWGYKDTLFRSGLESLGFTVYDSCVSNYNYTPFSLASTTYGTMLPISGQQYPGHQEWFLLEEKIRQSPVLNFFRARGYETHILSFIGTDFNKSLDVDRGEIVTFRSEIVASSAMGILLSKFINQQSVSLGYYNWEIVDKLQALLNPVTNKNKSVFVYAHLIMPHGPFVPLENKSTRWKGQFLEYENSWDYLSHVKYTDSIVLDLFHKGFDSLSSDQKSNTIVILQADHGCNILRKHRKDIQLKSSFGILNAVLWPNNSAGGFYNGMSSVNTFRILFRDLWGIKLGILSDSTVNVHPLIKTEN
jgi:hypothetical protein